MDDNNSQFFDIDKMESALLKEPTESELERIFDAFNYECDSCTETMEEFVKGVQIIGIYKHNACNYTIIGEIDVNGILYGFTIENGDWNGTAIRFWGNPEDRPTYIPLEPVRWSFVPINSFLKTENSQKYEIYLNWRKQEWFKEMERNYNYDRFFQPGYKVEKYYSDWATSKGMKTGVFEEKEE